MWYFSGVSFVRSKLSCKNFFKISYETKTLEVTRKTECSRTCVSMWLLWCKIHGWSWTGSSCSVSHRRKTIRKSINSLNFTRKLRFFPINVVHINYHDLNQKLDQCDPDDAESGPLDEDFTPFQADDLSSDDAFLTPNTKVKPKTEELANKSAKSKEYRGKLGNFECDICGMVLTSLIRIRKHMTTIHAPKELECKLCGKQVQYMKQHLRLCHSSEQYKCDQCDAKFMKKTDWINHARIHTGEHPFVSNSFQCFHWQCGKFGSELIGYWLDIL